MVRENGVQDLDLEDGKYCFLIVQANGCQEPFDIERLRRATQKQPDEGGQVGDNNNNNGQQQPVIKQISESNLISSLGRMELQID